MALIHGKPMIQWVYERASQVSAFEAVIVATDDDRILSAVNAFGGRAVMTGSHHASGTDRVWEVAQGLPNASLIFNVQGDEPLLDPHCLEDAVRRFSGHHEHVDMVTLMAPIQSMGEFQDPNVVKVVVNQQGEALYFSRAPIPFVRQLGANAQSYQHAFRHIGVYGFRRQALERFVQLPVSPLENLEKLEQLRALEAGMRIWVHPIEKAPIGVDTPEDLVVVQDLLSQSCVS